MFVTAIQQHVITGCMLSLIGCALPAFSQTTLPQNAYVTFEVPDSHGTVPVAINNLLTVTGYDYSGATPEPKGFLRDASGNVTSFAPDGCLRTFRDRHQRSGICHWDLHPAAGLSARPAWCNHLAQLPGHHIS